MQSILMGKLAGLSANTTANRESQVDFGESRDFLNRYGDQVAEEVLKDNPELNYRLNSPYQEGFEYEEGRLISKLTGRLPILSIDEQEEVMQQVEMGYDALMEELDSFLDYLISKKDSKRNTKLKQDWAGGLKDVKISAIELQKKALDWRQK